MISRKKLLALFAAAICAATPLTGADLTLVQAGKSDYCIVIPAAATSMETKAAEELRNHLRLMSGARLKIVSEAEVPADTPAIRIGNTAAAQAIVDLEQLPPDSIVIQTQDKDLILAGHPQRGALYAVYTLLEDDLGVRWWSSEDTFIPKTDTVTVKEQNRRYSPPVVVREAFYTDPWKNPIFAARSKTNGHFAEIPAAYGSHQQFIDFVHTMRHYLPPAKYFAAHPEWYALRDGKRLDGNNQPCLTNVEMQNEFIKNVLEIVKNHPEHKMISISQNDNMLSCQCENCLAVDAEEGSPAGTLLRFVNRVAAEIAKVRPDMMIETLAYQYTRKPPRITRPAPNVIVRLCNIECNNAESMAEGEENASFREDIKAWSEITDQLYIWSYVTNFKDYIMPYANWRHLASDIRFFANYHAVAIFAQGDYGSVNGDFVRARFWVLSHLLWNPELDQKELEREFFNGYYGAAGEKLLAYRDFLEECSIESGAPLYCLRTNTFGWLKPQNILKAYELYAEAEAAVKGQAPYEARVRRERLSLDHAFLRAVPILRREARANGRRAVFPYDPVKLAEEWARLVAPDEEWREGAKMGSYPAQLKVQVAADDPVPEQCRILPGDEYDCFDDSRFVIHREGVESFREKDRAAANGSAVRLPGNFHNWSVQLPLDPIYKHGKWRFHFDLRAENVASGNVVVSIGIYDYLSGKDLIAQEIKGSDVLGKSYRTISTPAIELPDGALVLWVQPWGGQIYVDRIWMTYEP